MHFEPSEFEQARLLFKLLFTLPLFVVSPSGFLFLFDQVHDFNTLLSQEKLLRKTIVVDKDAQGSPGVYSASPSSLLRRKLIVVEEAFFVEGLCNVREFKRASDPGGGSA